MNIQVPIHNYNIFKNKKIYVKQKCNITHTHTNEIKLRVNKPNIWLRPKIPIEQFLVLIKNQEFYLKIKLVGCLCVIII